MAVTCESPLFEAMNSPFKNSLDLPPGLVGRAAPAAMAALVLVMALISAAITMALGLQPEPFSWEGPGIEEADIESAMHFDANGHLEFIQVPTRLAEFYDALSKDMAFQVLDDMDAEVFASSPGQALEVLRRLPVHATAHTTRTYEDSIPMRVLTTPIERDGRRYLLRTARSDRLALAIRSGGGAIFYGAAILTASLAVLVFSCVALWTARRTAKLPREASAAAIEPGNLK